MAIHHQLKKLYKSIRFKPSKGQEFKNIHDWKFEVVKGTLEKTKAVLKISHNFHQSGYFQILNEIAADNLIKRFEHKSRTRAPHYRRVLLNGSDSTYTWLAKEFVGDPFGISYFVVHPKFKKNQRQLINKAFNELDRLQAIPYPEFQQFIPQRFPSVDSATIVRRLGRIYKNDEHKKTLHFFLDNQSVLHQKKVFVHGDFIISNLIISRGIVYLTDFEFASSDHPMTDMARLWRTNQLNPGIRKEIIKRYVNTRTEEIAFRAALIRDLFYFLIIYGRVGDKTASVRGKFMKESCIEEFIAAGEGMKALEKLTKIQAEKFTPIEKELIDKPYR